MIDGELFQALEEHAIKNYGGHLTIMRFTTNWRVGFFTPNHREDIDEFSVGSTFHEAAAKALAEDANK